MKTYTNLRMNPETHKELKILAAQNDTSIIDLMKILIDFYKQQKQEVNSIDAWRIQMDRQCF